MVYTDINDTQLHQCRRQPFSLMFTNLFRSLFANSEYIHWSSSGRTAVFGTAYLGSNPSRWTNFDMALWSSWNGHSPSKRDYVGSSPTRVANLLGKHLCQRYTGWTKSPQRKTSMMIDDTPVCSTYLTGLIQYLWGVPNCTWRYERPGSRFDSCQGCQFPRRVW